MKQKPVQLDGEKLTIDQVVSVARGYAPAALPQTARRRMQRSRRWVERSSNREWM